MSWDEAHGYTQKCAHCGQATDSTFCSTRCELDELAAARAERDADDFMCGETTAYGQIPPQSDDDRGNEPDGSHSDQKHERAEYDRDKAAYHAAKEV